LTIEKNRQSQSSLDLARWIAQQLDRKGAQGVSVLETQNHAAAIADYVVVATGTSSRHMESLLDAPCEELKKLGYPPLSVDRESAHWVLADLGDVVLHVFDSEGRTYYDLEGFLKQAPRVDWADAQSSTALR